LGNNLWFEAGSVLAKNALLLSKLAEHLRQVNTINTMSDILQ
jgi:hypothetical protein